MLMQAVRPFWKCPKTWPRCNFPKLSVPPCIAWDKINWFLLRKNKQTLFFISTKNSNFASDPRLHAPVWWVNCNCSQNIWLYMAFILGFTIGRGTTDKGVRPHILAKWIEHNFTVLKENRLRMSWWVRAIFLPYMKKCLHTFCLPFMEPVSGSP